MHLHKHYNNNTPKHLKIWSVIIMINTEVIP